MKWWICDSCGWTCLAGTDIPLAEAECDNCGGELREMDSSGPSAATRAYGATGCT